jgi:hypothetical protein
VLVLPDEIHPAPYWQAKDALYNFISTFSGTHYMTSRTLIAELGFNF